MSKCKACELYEVKVSQVLKEYDETDPVLEYKLHDLKINRGIDCECKENNPQGWPAV